MFLNECDDGTEKWGFDGIYPEPETIVKVFSWAQWDCVNQVWKFYHEIDIIISRDSIVDT